MSDNKFIKRLKGEQTAKSVLEIKNESAKTSFANMPQGTSNAIDVFSDHRGNATAVLNGTTNWKVSNSELLLADAVSGDGQDFTSTYSVSGSGLWVNASYTFPSTGDPRHPVAMVFNPSTKWVLKVCGDNLIVDGGSTVDFTMLVKIGTASVYSKNFTIRESAGQFSKEFIIDFGEANSDVVKAGGLSTLTVQLLCGTANASARIYNGMTVLTCLQRKVDASAVSNSSANVEDVLDGNIIPSDYFSNPAFIDQIEDGDTAVAIFARDGDDVNLDHWEQPIPARTGNAGKFLQTPDGDGMSWKNVEISDVTGLQTELDLKADKSTTYTKTETDTLLSGKQDNISDLSTIRSNAQAGKAASDTIATYGDIVTHDVAEFATAAQGAKADTALQAGDNVSELVNDAGYLVMGDLTNFVTKNTSQTISGLKTFSADITLSGTTSIKNTTNGVSYTMLYRDASGIHVGTSTQALLLAGSNARPKFNNNDIAMLSDIPTAVSQLTNDTGFITNAVNDLQNYTLTSDLATVATSGSYNDLSNKPTIGNATLTIQKNSTTIDTFTANATSNKTIDIAVPTKTSDITNDSNYQNGTQVATAISTHNTSTTAHSNQFNAITEKIPAEASSSNKLADKAFVNSSIATNTANFIGTFNSVAELEAYSGTVTNNDYAFVIVTDSAGNTAYDRYKYTTATTPASWVFEYELNNSSFTAEQWAAINSGANTTNIGQIATNTTTISNHIGNTSNPHQVTKAQVGLGNVDNTSDLAKPISTATQTALNAKANAADLATVATSGSYNDLSDKPTIPTVNNATLTIQKNGTTVQTFTANQSTNATANISVPTKTSDITNDSGFITSSALAPYALSADLATVATTGDYDDLSNKPTIPAAQVNSDWNANSGVAQILNKPTLATVATSGSYNDLSNKPTIPTVNNPTITITQGGVTKGSFTLNQATGDTIALDAGGGSGGGYHPDLFTWQWADHELNDVQWLRADTFSWQSGAVYQAAYQHLVDDIDGKTLQSETVGSTTIQFYLADDGHKICPASEESNVTAIYNATGVAWYYIIDTTNQRFKLPRTKFGFTGIRNGVGKFVNAGLPNITGSSYGYVSSANRGASGALQMSGGSGKDATGGGGWWVEGVTVRVDASASNSIYGASDTVQPKATEMYLYFYVGQFTQTALENTAGLNAELFAEKIDLNGNNATFAHIVETYNNGNSWYRVYSDGWCEQGGLSNGGGGSFVTTTFLKPFVDTSYNIVTALLNDENNSTCFGVKISNRTASSFQSRTWYSSGNAGNYNFNWRASGYIA